MLMQALQENEIYREIMIKSAVREAADFLVDFIRKVRYTVTVQSYADLFSADACIQMELRNDSEPHS